ncbi:hypothetical protein [Methylobacterium radiotolerans]|uniref:hypothetical protein n=1 Tax=Methylobacterium radiotolerans TaxID=31998 RepID=UPI0015F6F3E0|nr:hypothetical protein [Methylobacterium radiotolerans]
MSTPTDTFAAHVIPTRIEQKGGTCTILATLSLTPQPGASGGHCITDWPRWIAAEFGNGAGPSRIGAWIRPVTLKGEGPSQSASRVVNLYADRYAARSKRLGEVWKQLFSGCLGELHDHLAAAAVCNAKTSLREIAQVGTGTGEGVPDVIAPPAGDLAVQVSLERARLIAESTVVANEPSACSAVAMRRASRVISSASGTYRQRPWARRPDENEKETLPTFWPGGKTYNPYRYDDGPAPSPPASPEERERAKKAATSVEAMRSALVEERLLIDRGLADLLRPLREKAAEIAKHEGACLRADTVAAACTAVETARFRSETGSVCATASACLADDDGLRAPIDRSLAPYHAASLGDYHDDPKGPPDLPDHSRAAIRWQALQSMHGLSRAMQLVIDVKIEIGSETFRALAPALSVPADKVGASGQATCTSGARFFEIGLTHAGQSPRSWTLAKVDPAPKAGGMTESDGAWPCWPATLEEWLLSNNASCGKAPTSRIVDQTGGVMDLEAHVSAEKGDRHYHRFDVTSLDVAGAADAEIRRQTALANLEVVRKTSVPAADQHSIEAPRTLRTAGLQLIDNWRDITLIKEFLTAWRAADDTCGPVRLDAADLTTGIRLDIGSPQQHAPGAHGGWAWRSLTERQLSFRLVSDSNGESRPIDDLVDAFLPVGQRRGAVEAAVLASPTRLLTNRLAGIAQGGAKTAFAEQTLACWDGDPLGQQAGEFSSFADADALPLTQVVDLARHRQGPETRPFPLRFGAAYWLAARAVFVGGVCRPLEDATALIEDGLSFPASRRELRRFLRQERIAAPAVAVPAAHVLTEFASPRAGLDGMTMVVRSQDPREGLGATADEAWRFAPAETTRVLFAPPVPLKFAVQHGVFDGPSMQSHAPEGGLQDFDYDAEWGGFPAFDPSSAPVEASIRDRFYERERRTQKLKMENHHRTPEDEQIEREMKAGLTQPGEGVPSGLSIARPRRRGHARPQQYYPDPAARWLVIALKRTGSEEGYLCDEPIVIDLYPGARSSEGVDMPGYPDSRPVLLSVRTWTKGTTAAGSYQELRDRAGVARDTQWPRQPPEAGLRALAAIVTLHLAPGEDYEVETWCVPGEAHLRAWFEGPEAVALLKTGAFKHDPDGAAHTLAAEKAADALKLDRNDARYKEIGREIPRKPYSVRRGDMVAPWSAVAVAARSIHRAMLLRPVPELAATRRLRVIHAAEAPAKASRFANGTPPVFLRVSAATAGTILAGTKPWTEWTFATNEDGGDTVLVGGKATVEARTTEALELRIRAVAPRNQPLDAPERGRTPENRARGLWPNRNPRTGEIDYGRKVDPPGHAGPTGACDSQREPSYLQRLYGFDVRADGSVVLPREEVVFARWPIAPSSADEIDLLQLTRNSLPGAVPSGTASDKFAKTALRESLFGDGKARRLSVSLAATSRTARFVPPRRVHPDACEAALDARRRTISSDVLATDVVLRSVIRPAAIPPKSLLPAFVWSQADREGVVQATRATRIRIRIDRPWFTSGVEERLGLVLWPPNLRTIDPIALAGNRVDRLEPLDGDDPPGRMQLGEQTFTDEDLGPGGAFITRWGADPISASGDLNWFVPWHSFRDLVGSSSPPAPALDSVATENEDSGQLWPETERYRPRLVENVLMPIPEGADARQKQGGDPAQQQTTRFMIVSLATYMPRFDPDFEHWYVDVALDAGPVRDPFVRFGLVRFQPHAPRHLQVSGPVTEWVQIAGGSRTVIARREKDEVRVSVIAAVAWDGKGPCKEDCELKDGFETHIRATLIERRVTEVGLVVERAVRDDNQAIVCKEKPVSFGPSLLFEESLPLPTQQNRDQLGGQDEVTYAVAVEEFWVGKPSGYSNEPVMRDEDVLPSERIRESGPRFAVRLDLPRSGLITKQ